MNKKHNIIPMVILIMGCIVLLGVAVLGLAKGYMDAKSDAKTQAESKVNSVSKTNKTQATKVVAEQPKVEIKEHSSLDVKEQLPPTTLYPLDFDDVFLNKEDYTIICKDLVENSDMGPCLNVEFINKTRDKNLVYYLNGIAINSIELPTNYMERVAAGQSGEYIVPLNCKKLTDIGVSSFTHIELDFTVFDEDDYMVYKDNTTTHIYPYGESKSTTHELQLQETDKILVDNKYVTLVLLDRPAKGKTNAFVEMYAISKSDQDFILNIQGAEENKYLVNDLFLFPLGTGHVGYPTLEIRNTDRSNLTDTIATTLKLDVLVLDTKQMTELDKETVVVEI